MSPANIRRLARDLEELAAMLEELEAAWVPPAGTQVKGTQVTEHEGIVVDLAEARRRREEVRK